MFSAHPVMTDTPDAPSGPSKEEPSGGTAVAEPEQKSKSAKPDQSTKPKSPPPGQLPPWKVLLHNDDKNDFLHVITSIVTLTPLTPQAAYKRTLEAHKSGVALLLVTHKERAELYQDQFKSKSLTVTIEPADKG